MKNAYTTFEIGKICHVYPTTVIKWIKDGKLSSFSTPGGHRRIKSDELLKFLKRYNMPLPPEFGRKHSRRKILVVDDDAEMATLVKWILESENASWDVSSVTTGFGAGVKVIEWQPDLIILDFLMPDLNGYEVCQMLRRDTKMKNLPVIALTCLSSGDEKKKILASGVTDYLAKPFQNEQLVDKVRKYISDIRPLSQSN